MNAHKGKQSKHIKRNQSMRQIALEYLWLSWFYTLKTSSLKLSVILTFNQRVKKLSSRYLTYDICVFSRAQLRFVSRSALLADSRKEVHKSNQEDCHPLA